MASWSARRRATYIFVILFVVALVVVGAVFTFFDNDPTCFDGVQNGDEEGVDCGGVCERVCSFQTVEPTILWSRFFEVVPGVYSVVSVIENQNINAEATGVPYSFKIRDDRGILIEERRGETFIPAGEQFAVFESGIVAGTRIPRRVFFELQDTPRWRQAVPQANLEVSDVQVENVDKEPRISAVVQNTTLQEVQNIIAVIVVFGESGNAIASSRTVIDRLQAEDEKNIIFTWPRSFSERVVRTEVFTTVVPIE